MTFYITGAQGNAQVSETAETPLEADTVVERLLGEGCRQIYVYDEDRSYTHAELKERATALRTYSNAD
jgi:hypothetical protein